MMEKEAAQETAMPSRRAPLHPYADGDVLPPARAALQLHARSPFLKSVPVGGLWAPAWQQAGEGS